ncbi:MAG: TRAP-type C4-dicarboxylate transport system, small permease component [Rhodobacteraceae bacterium HLUCCA12]|nr:MAG: TRAP-type C4-dicarboxylate transport system, small permease component [Rhodobacteraceae bacterium HLUCCA12]
MRGEVNWRRLFGTVHDIVTLIGFYCAVFCLALITSIYVYEVGARYFFSAPTSWSSALVSYLLLYIVFLAMPELTRHRVHVFISIFLDTLPERQAVMLTRVLYTIAGIACLIGAYFSFGATSHQFLTGITTVNEWRVPKWLVSVAIPYGLFSTGLYYLRHVMGRISFCDERVS